MSLPDLREPTPSGVRRAAADGAPRALPCRLGRYTLFDHIGRGGMADIYLAVAESGLGARRRVVVKEILPRLASAPRFAELLAAEAKLAAQIRHANVVQVEDLGRQDDVLYIAMEYVEGLDLRAVLRGASRARVPFPVEFALLVVSETLRALDHAHRFRGLGLVHRDVSPSNVLVSFDGEVKLCDFGIARANDVAPGDELVQGKAGYMSPEQARGEPLDARSDVLAAGVLLWEMLAGRRLRRARPGEALIDVARRGEAPDVPALGLPEEWALHAIVAHALEPERDRRYASAAEMLRDLEHYAAAARMVASPLRLGAWALDHFGGDVVDGRRARELALTG